MKTAEQNTVSAVIVTCGKNNYLEVCLDSLQEQSFSFAQVIVVDNSCNADFRKKITTNYPEVEFYSNPQNLFYCRAQNLGIAKSSGDFLLCLNDDVILENNFIEVAVKGFYLDNRIGMVSGKILRYDKETVDSTGLFLSYWRTAKERGYSLKNKGQFEQAGYIFGVNGAVAFYRKAMLEDLKEGGAYFDEDFHFFYEDLDLAWRANRKGWKGYYLPAAIAYHARGGTARKKEGVGRPHGRRFLDDALHLELIKNRYLVIIKNETYSSFVWHLPGLLFYDLIIWCYILMLKPRLLKSFIFDLSYLKKVFQKINSQFSVDKLCP